MRLPLSAARCSGQRLGFGGYQSQAPGSVVSGFRVGLCLVVLLRVVVGVVTLAIAVVVDAPVVGVAVGVGGQRSRSRSRRSRRSGSRSRSRRRSRRSCNAAVAAATILVREVRALRVVGVVRVISNPRKWLLHQRTAPPEAPISLNYGIFPKSEN